ncbi:FK506-binding protein 15 isoform X2 [Monomorium pharaonis]|uniref:FK506-binding protein 15 isoform X2 n=1 Tax=Monomorium pharaonis TaxID=307658 RepID=UPI00063F8F4C|nr:FK506-binding protein 15 isoform X2 [Monomorium pharaonis]
MSAQNQLPNLDKIFRDDDESDFVPSGGSNLAAIFGLQPRLTDSHSIKQMPKKSNTRYNIQQTVSSSKTEVLIAKAVHAFKLQNGQYASVGKLGMALTGNIVTRLYQIILYKTKQEYISIATVTCDFAYTIQANNYASYYDDNKENWSILFENNESYLEFAIEVGLARYFALQEKGANVIYQDLMSSNKDVIAKEGDNICIKYFVGTEIIQPFKTNFVMSQTMTVEISTDENWERILLGSSKGLKRVLFLPPSKQISLGPGFPKERDIMLIIEITDIREQEKDPLVPKNSTSGKAAIISRMAKMGQSILPKMSLPSTTDSEDTEDDVPHKSSRHKRIEQSESVLQKKNLSHESLNERKAAQKTVESKTEVPSTDSSTYKPLVTSPSLTPQWAPYFTGHYVTMDNQMYPVSQAVNRTISTAMDPGMNMLLSETRIANAEIRMGISKISDNVQKLLDKFHVLELQNATTPTSDKATLDASWKMLLALNAGTKDNEILKLKNTDKDMSDEKIREAQSKISSLENDLKGLKEEKESLFQINENLSKKIQELEARLADKSDDLKKTKEALEVAKNTIAQYKEENASLEDRLSQCHKQHVLQVDTISSRQKDVEKKNKEIKQIMNKTYYTLSEKLADESCSELSFDYVKSTIANTIKHITLQVLYEDSDEEDKESKTTKDVIASVNKTVDCQVKEPTIEKSLLNPDSNNDFPVKCVEISRSTTIMPIFKNEPPPVPPEGIDEIDSESD